MAIRKIGFSALATLTLWGALEAAEPAKGPAPQQMLQFKPRQVGVNLTTPAEAELASCTVELLKGQKLANGKAASGWVLKDAQGRLIRRYFDSDGDNQIDVWSFYLNGDEAYREVDSNINGKVDQYRWLGGNGSKWGVDLNEDGKIDGWKQISAEEVSQEVLAAVQTKDLARLEALMITKADLDALELPNQESLRIKGKMQNVAAAFQATCTALAPKLNEKVKWVHLETGVPECIPADALGSKNDLIRHKHGTILFSDGEKINDFLQTGEMILVGKAWRIVEAPTAGGTSTSAQVGSTNMGGVEITEDIKELIQKLKEVDDKYKDQSTPAKVAEYNVARAAVIEQIIAKLKDDKSKEDWIKQAADCYSTAAQNGDKTVMTRLSAWRAQLEKAYPGSNLAAYVTYRELSADYAMKLQNPEIKPADMQKLQDAWKDTLAKFVQDYKTAEDTPDALMQLGMVNEFVGKETEAKNWYAELVKNFAKNPLAPKAEGAVRRLTCEGQDFELTSQVLGGTAAFDVKNLKGKTVVVYYWASWNTQCVADFAKLKQVMTSYAPKGVELVCVNLDNSAPEAVKFLQTNAIGGTHLHQKGGLESPPAIHYGVMVLPNLFVVDGKGKVANRNAQVATLEDDLKKLVK